MILQENRKFAKKIDCNQFLSDSSFRLRRRGEMFGNDSWHANNTQFDVLDKSSLTLFVHHVLERFCC